MPRKPGSAALARRLGSRIRALREEVGIKQEKLAWDADLNKGFLSQIEAGKRMPSVPVLFRLAREMGVEVADLVALDSKNPRLQVLNAARRLEAEQTQAAAYVEGRVRASPSHRTLTSLAASASNPTNAWPTARDERAGTVFAGAAPEVTCGSRLRRSARSSHRTNESRSMLRR